MRSCSLSLFAMLACFSESDSGDDVAASPDDTSETSAGATTSTTLTTAVPTTSDTTTTDESSSSSTSTGDTTTEGPIMCDADERPAIEIDPAWQGGWEGPFVLLPPDVPGCGPGLVDAAPAVGFVSEGCDCDCQPQCVTTFGASCGDGDSVAMGDDQCLGTNLERVAFAGLLADGSCAPVATTKVAGVGHRICEAPGACVPNVDAGVGPCIRQLGDHACPDGLERVALQPRLEPLCAECPSCQDDAATACENATLQAFTLGGCAGPSTPFEVGGCSAGAALSVALDVDVDCARGEHDGVATYCCAT